MMRFPLSRIGLRVKLVASFLTVALGTLLIFTIVITMVVQSYFTSTQLDTLRSQAHYRADQIEHLYVGAGESWNNLLGRNIQFATGDPAIFAIGDATGKQLICGAPAFLTRRNCDDASVLSALQQATQGQGQEVDGSIQVTTQSGTYSSLYVSIPLQLRDGQVIGAIFLSLPDQSRVFLNQVNTTVLILGLLLALAVVVFSIVFARSLTKPLESLTAAAEQMKLGEYTQRVPTPKSQDELGQLALTFNDMADTIEADITELRRQDQVRRDLIANIAHDLATPLTAIQGFSEALGDDMIATPQARQETALLIGREVQRLRRLVADMQNMTSLESGHIQLDLAPLEMRTFVDEVLSVIEPECEQAHISIQNDLPQDAPPVLADSDRIAQVLLNLLDNARRHTPSGGSITIGAVVKERQLLVSVRDTGVGIVAADLPHIFERFYRADRSRTGTTGGSGLGLAIVKAIITAHKGSIWAESTRGQGTTITFTLPLAPL